MSKDNLSDFWLSNVQEKTITNDISKNNLIIVLKDPDPCTGLQNSHALSTWFLTRDIASTVSLN